MERTRKHISTGRNNVKLEDIDHTNKGLPKRPIHVMMMKPIIVATKCGVEEYSKLKNN